MIQPFHDDKEWIIVIIKVYYEIYLNKLYQTYTVAEE